LFGAILGDIVGSPYEFDANNVKTKDFPLFSAESRFTDDTVMALAVAKTLLEEDGKDEEALLDGFGRNLRLLGRRYPDAGYGLRFMSWLWDDSMGPYGSCGNGSAMRVAAVGWAFDHLEDVRRVARLSARVTHDHPEGVKGAEAVATAIFLGRQGQSKNEIRNYIEKEFAYDLSRTCDMIRPTYHHVETCQQTVPEAFAAFLEGESFEDVLRLAVSLGGDSDTLTCIAGAMAEAHYGIDPDWKKAAYSYLPDDLAEILYEFDLTYGHFADGAGNPLHRALRFAEEAHRSQKRKGTQVDYITHPMEVFQLLTLMGVPEEVQLAGLLHDTAEDAGIGRVELAKEFGDRVASLVFALTEDKHKSWQERKWQKISLLPNAERDVKLLILADAVSNLRSMHYDHKQAGEGLWQRFNACKANIAWYYSGLQDAMQDLAEDGAARVLYWEMVGLYKDLFVEYYTHVEEPLLVQKDISGTMFMLTGGEGQWQQAAEMPVGMMPICRLRAEAMEDLWKLRRRDRTLDGNEKIEKAIGAWIAEPGEKTDQVVLQAIASQMTANAHFILPVEIQTGDNGAAVTYHFRTVFGENGSEYLVAFTTQNQADKGPASGYLPLDMGQVMELALSHDWVSGLWLNPWGLSHVMTCETIDKLSHYAES